MKRITLKTKWILAMLLAMSMILTTLSLASVRDHWDHRQYGPTSVGFSRHGLEKIDQVYNQLISDQQLPGAVLLVARQGKIAHLKALGMADIEAGKPMQIDTMFRIASMSKAIISVAALMEWERGAFKMDDLLSKYIPEFKNPKVIIPDPDGMNYTLEPAKREIAIWHLFTHTSGLAYWNFSAGSLQLNNLYVKAGLNNNGLSPVDYDNAEQAKRLASLPLKFHPGESFCYGYSSGVLARLVEITSGMSIEAYVRKYICKPLGMKDTYFHVPWEKVSRIARPYEVTESGLKRIEDGHKVGIMEVDPSYPYGNTTKLESGDSGLVSTISDYYNFLQMMLNKGALNGVRILQAKTVEMMIMNHTGNVYLSTGGFGPETLFGPFGAGLGWGLGVAVVVDPSRSWTWAHPGEWAWTGYWGTSFFVDPAEDLIIIQMEQTQFGVQPGQFAIPQPVFDAIIK
jgi:CubicO group peptidase (beta-lactamase class C family)